jgi:hypothetical protein
LTRLCGLVFLRPAVCRDVPPYVAARRWLRTYGGWGRGQGSGASNRSLRGSTLGLGRLAEGHAVRAPDTEVGLRVRWTRRPGPSSAAATAGSAGGGAVGSGSGGRTGDPAWVCRRGQRRS